MAKLASIFNLPRKAPKVNLGVTHFDRAMASQALRVPRLAVMLPRSAQVILRGGRR